MTVAAGLNLPMIVMACGTCQFCVDTRIALQLFHLFFMAAQAGYGDVVGHANLKGRMGINVAIHALLQLEMIPVVVVTLAAERNNPDICRRMPLMALSTEGLVCLTFDSDCKNNIFMALTAVAHIDCGFDIFCVLLCLCRKVRDDNTQHTEANKTHCKTENFSHNWPWGYLSPMIAGKNMIQLKQVVMSSSVSSQSVLFDT